jgi:hypothetical protein
MPSNEDDRVLVGTPVRLQRDAGQVERAEQVGVAELGRQAHPEDVERGERPVGVHGEMRHGMLAHQRLEVRPHRVAALGEHSGPLVEDLVEDHDALIRQADLVRVGVQQRPAHVTGVPVLDGRVQLAADVLDRLLDARQERLESREDRLDRHREGSHPAIDHGPARSPA